MLVRKKKIKKIQGTTQESKKNIKGYHKVTSPNFEDPIISKRKGRNEFQLKAYVQQETDHKHKIKIF
jgi:hypothetical protein